MCSLQKVGMGVKENGAEAKVVSTALSITGEHGRATGEGKQGAALQYTHGVPRGYLMLAVINILHYD